MITDAIVVQKGIKDKNYHSDPKTHDVFLKNSVGEFTSLIRGYENCFQYLKFCDSIHKDYGDSNSKKYGYLKIRTGSISYAEIPKQFPLCLGVSGSLEHLSQAEENALKSYNITQKTYYPSFWGKSRLEFNPLNTKDICYLITEDDKNWHDAILQSSELILSQNRAVLIFFDTLEKLENFNNLVAQSKLPNVRVLDPNTSPAKCKEIIDISSGEAKAVTLLTRGFGRGEDFRPSTEVAKNGGIHVIQTFLSLDMKEEIQIRGRTARKSERGSYSLILCKLHASELLKQEIIISLSYEELNKLRYTAFEKAGAVKENAVKQAFDKHLKTITFLENTISYFSTKQRNKNSVERQNIISELYKLQSL